MSWGGWSIQAPLAYVAFAGLLYWLGGRRWSRRRRDDRDHLRTLAFVGGLATIVISLEGPIDLYADTLFWVHMVQHVLLLTVAPPLILLGRPWPRMWRALPLGTRARLGRTLARGRWTAPLRALVRPLPAWVLFNATMLLWHLPAAYDAALRSSATHQLEHATFFFTGLLFWAHVIDPGPLRARLSWPARVAYSTGAMVVGCGLAIVLLAVPRPLYAHYADLIRRPGGLSALTDQRLAAAVMAVPGSVSYMIAMMIGFQRWPARDAEPVTAAAAAPALEPEHSALTV